MELKEGMYVRYTRGMINGNVPPRIAKIVDCLDNKLIKIDNGQVILNEDIIGEPSEHLIDLIEVGDYVNGKKVTSADPVNKKGTKRYLDLGDYYYIDKSEDIQNIVTKEQFETCKYVVERNKLNE